MKRNRILRILGHSMPLVLIGACLFAGIASAQAVTGTFTLPYETKWGGAMLPAGNYQLSLEREKSTSAIFYVDSGARHVALVMAHPTNTVKNEADNYFIVVSRGSQHVVERLNLGCIGTGFAYRLPKGMEPVQVAAERGRVERIPILASISSVH